MSDATSDFAIPGNLELPAELAGAPPRDVPESVKTGPLADSQRRVFWGCIFAAGVCFILSVAPFVDTLAIYVLPLGYLSWIGALIVAGAVVSSLRGGELKAALNYVRNGTAAFGRVVELIKYPTLVVDGQPTMHAFQAAVETRHPDSDLIVVSQLKSRDFRSDVKDRINTRFRVGDYVPVVWIPGKFHETLRIYDFLELTPEASLVRSAESGKAPLWQVMAVVIAVPLFFFALFWNIYAHGRYSPIDFDFTEGLIPFCIGGGLALAVLVACWLAARRKRRETDQKNVESLATGEAIELRHEAGAIRGFLFAAVLVAGAILMGGLTFLCWCFTANALLDRSPRTAEPVEITEMVQVTHSFLFREFKMKYRRMNEKEEHTLLTTPEHLAEFNLPIGSAQIRAGRFGWPWVETIDPLAVAPAVGRGQ